MQKNVDLGVIKANSVIVVAGPTASGKSGLAMNLALKYNGVVINADASQVYKDIPVISAAPDEADKAKVEHLLYGILEAGEKNSVSDWCKHAVEAIKNVWERGKTPIVVGGTGFYIESLVNGLSPIPETSVYAKKNVAEIMEKSDACDAYEYLQKLDAAGAQLVNKNDTTRVRRALEIFIDTGVSIAEWFKKPMIKPLPEAEFKVVLLLPELSEIERNCSLRFDAMMDNGALQEVERLVLKNLPDNSPIMKAIGVPELCDYIKGNLDKQQAVDLAKLHTRQYAKRQLTWFRNRFKKIGCELIVF